MKKTLKILVAIFLSAYFILEILNVAFYYHEKKVYDDKVKAGMFIPIGHGLREYHPVIVNWYNLIFHKENRYMLR